MFTRVREEVQGLTEERLKYRFCWARNDLAKGYPPNPRHRAANFSTYDEGGNVVDAKQALADCITNNFAASLASDNQSYDPMDEAALRGKKKNLPPPKWPTRAELKAFADILMQHVR
ncbi:hypothetical protein F53441_8145 [Fusarium austroafricanum]|uniref:Uncharacterized protein n=1 Tax=Fusarium austroafricanum TaxID=2364996 RepID=A0A8H4KG16_9HYPO|nr:hypothetical protein F53441_8145 [Fusarium austroafricanum]